MVRIHLPPAESRANLAGKCYRRAEWDLADKLARDCLAIAASSFRSCRVAPDQPHVRLVRPGRESPPTSGPNR